ncbi:MAG: 5'-methylthioadenosine/S-adenosylhomocysteine nucleosidase [Myxococcota bacterium]
MLSGLGRVAGVFFASLLGACAAQSRAEGRAKLEAPLTRTLVITATPAEFSAVEALVEGGVERRSGPSRVIEGRISGVDVVLLLSGVSIVYASMTTQWALDTYSVDKIVVSGVAAGLSPDLNVGDVTVARRWGKYDEMKYFRSPQAAQGHDGIPSSSAGFPPFGFMRPRGLLDIEGGRSRRFWFEADSELIRTLRVAPRDSPLPSCLEGQCVQEAPRIRVVEAGVSGSVFMDNQPFAEYLRATFDASVLEMETAAIAAVAHVNGVPFIAFRAISDLAASVIPAKTQYQSFHGLAAANAARTAAAFIKDASE